MKLVYQTSQQTNFSLTGSSLSLASSDSIKEVKGEEEESGEGSEPSLLLIEDDSSAEEESSPAGIVAKSGGAEFRISRCDSQESISSSYKVLTMDHVNDPISLTSNRRDSFHSEDDPVEVSVLGGTKAKATELQMVQTLTPSLLQRLYGLSVFRNLTMGSIHLYWAPERRTTPLSLSLNTIWWMWSPLITSNSALPSYGQTSQRSLELRLPNDCKGYLDSSSIACTSEDDGKRIVQQIFQEEMYTKARSIVQDAKFVVDIGANIGAFAAWVAAQHDDQDESREPTIKKEPLTILCLEPVPTTFEACERNAARAMRKHRNTKIQVAKMGLAPAKKRSRPASSSPSPTKLTYFEETPSSSTTHPHYKYESSIKPLLQSDKAFLDYYKGSRPSLCSMIERLPLQGLRQAVCELAVAFLWRWRPVSVNLGSLLQAFHMTKTDLPDTIDLLKVDIGVAMDFIEDWWWPKVQHVLIEEVASATPSHRTKVLDFLSSKGFELLSEDETVVDKSAANRYMILQKKNTSD